jgi:hypothetical protein
LVISATKSLHPSFRSSTTASPSISLWTHIGREPLRRSLGTDR